MGRALSQATPTERQRLNQSWALKSTLSCWPRPAPEQVQRAGTAAGSCTLLTAMVGMLRSPRGHFGWPGPGPGVGRCIAVTSNKQLSLLRLCPPWDMGQWLTRPPHDAL